MIGWFMNLDQSSQVVIIAAIIAAIGSIIAAIINGIFNIFHKKKDEESPKYVVNQTGYDNATQIGVQLDNKKEDE